MIEKTDIVIDKEKIIENCQKTLAHLPISEKMLLRLCQLNKCITLSSKSIYKNECIEEFYSYETRVQIDRTFGLSKES